MAPPKQQPFSAPLTSAKRSFSQRSCACSYFTDIYEGNCIWLDEQQGKLTAEEDKQFAVVQEVVPLTAMSDVISLMKAKRQLEVAVVRFADDLSPLRPMLQGCL